MTPNYTYLRTGDTIAKCLTLDKKIKTTGFTSKTLKGDMNMNRRDFIKTTLAAAAAAGAHRCYPPRRRQTLKGK